MEPVLATDRCHVLEDPWGDHAIPVRFDDPYSAAEAIAQAGPFDGIIAVADRPTFLAALAAAKLGIAVQLSGFGGGGAQQVSGAPAIRGRGIACAPILSRAARSGSGRDCSKRAPYPCVLKPLGLSASRGVIRADDPAEFVAAFRRIEALLARPEIQVLREEQNRYIQVESFIEGKEYAVEGVLTEGRLADAGRI